MYAEGDLITLHDECAKLMKEELYNMYLLLLSYNLNRIDMFKIEYKKKEEDT
jgi:hypothetical protein